MVASVYELSAAELAQVEGGAVDAFIWFHQAG
jgi:bacteriocin-like protein